MPKLTTELLLQKSQGPYGALILLTVAFFESTVLLLPVELVILSLVGISTYPWYVLSLIATVGSTLGGVSGYFLGSLGWEPLAVPILQTITNLQFVSIDGRMDILLPTYATYALNLPQPTYLLSLFEAWSAWIVAVFALSPLPYRLVTMASGAADVALGVFVAASFLARGARYTIVALLVSHVSPKVHTSLRRAAVWITVAALLIVTSYVLIKMTYLTF